jgi:hypothetical protein
MLTLDPDTEIDVESEFIDDEHLHAIAFCYQHRGMEFFPVSGSIVEAICGRLIRVRIQTDSKKKCDECKKPGKHHCYVCGKELYG